MSARQIAEKILGSIMCIVYGISLIFVWMSMYGPSPKNKTLWFSLSILVIVGMAASGIFAFSYSKEEDSTEALAYRWSGIGVGYILPLFWLFFYFLLRTPEFIRDPNDPTGMRMIKNPQFEAMELQEKERECKNLLDTFMWRAENGYYPVGKVLNICGKEYVVE